jgi:hypothetical protein
MRQEPEKRYTFRSARLASARRPSGVGTDALQGNVVEPGPCCVVAGIFSCRPAVVLFAPLRRCRRLSCGRKASQRQRSALLVFCATAASGWSGSLPRVACRNPSAWRGSRECAANRGRRWQAGHLRSDLRVMRRLHPGRVSDAISLHAQGLWQRFGGLFQTRTHRAGTSGRRSAPC